MKKQNYSNHRQFNPLYHYVTLVLLFILLVGAGYFLFENKDSNLLLSILLIVSIFTSLIIAFNSRLFALKAQDRAIRAEENLRYFILTGKRLSDKITIRQIIALRFASDEEFVPLIEKTIHENLTSKQIKKEIKDWRGDYHRV